MDAAQKILIAEDDPDIRALITFYLEKNGWEVVPAANGIEAVELFKSSQPDLLLLDVNMPGKTGYQVLKEIRDGDIPAPPAIFLTALADPDDMIHGLELGADDYIAKPFDHRILVARITASLRNKAHRDQLNAKADQLAELSKTDPLTGLGNRREMESMLTRSTAAVDRQHFDLSAIMFDIDHFKFVNDTYGHVAGDQVLVEAANIMRHTLRTPDGLARWGGEEFFVMLPFTDVDGAELVAQRLRQALESAALVIDGNVIRFTASFGVVQYFEGMDLVKEADAAMYMAKNAGRNTICVGRRHDEELSEPRSEARGA